MSASPARRPIYTPSGRFELSGLLVQLPILAGVAALFATGFACAVRLGVYAIGYIWVFPVLILIGLVQKAVANSNCRNRLVGACVGLFAGLVTQLGMYHVDQCARWGVGWGRLDRLPGYVTFRMETDGWWFPDARMPAVWALPANQQIDPYRTPRIARTWNWTAFQIEFGVLVLVPAAAGWYRARRPFSERQNRWLSRELLILTHESAKRLGQALRAETVAEWVRSAMRRTRVSEPHTKVFVWYCPRATSADEPEADVYVSFGRGAALQLAPEEAAALVGTVPGLMDLSNSVAEQYAASGDAGSDDPAAARLLRIDGPHVGRTKERGVIWVGRLGAWGAVLALPLSGFVFIGAFCLLDEIGVFRGVRDGVVLGGLVVVAVIYLFIIRVWYRPEADAPWLWLVWYYRRVVTQEAAKRGDALFPPDHPHAVYCDMIPRRAWSDLESHRDECECGLLLGDAKRGLLLFEGDRYRFIIPAASVERYGLEEVVSKAGEAGTTAGFFAVVLAVRTVNGLRELPLCAHAGIEGRNRYEQARALHWHIGQFLAGSPPDALLTTPSGEPGL